MENFQPQGSGLWHSERVAVLSGSCARWESSRNLTALSKKSSRIGVQHWRSPALGLCTGDQRCREPKFWLLVLVSKSEVGEGSSNKLAAFAPLATTQQILLAHSITSRSDIHRSQCILLPLSLFLVVTIYLRLPQACIRLSAFDVCPSIACP
jgi:hypothetical protein